MNLPAAMKCVKAERWTENTGDPTKARRAMSDKNLLN
jgi:hypothetical protein